MRGVSLKELKVLANIVKTSGEKYNPLVTYTNKTDKKEYQLLLTIQKKECQTDEQAVKMLYGEEEIGAKFLMLKMRLLRKLLNHLFFLDFNQPGLKVSHQHEQEVMNQLHFANMLIKKGALSIAKRIAVKAVDLAKEGQFTPLAVSGLEMLMLIYSEQLKLSAHQRVEKELARYRQILYAESETTALFQHVKLSLNQSVKARKENLPYLEASVKLLEISWQQHGSFTIFEQYYKLKAWHLELIGDFRELTALTRNAEELFQKKAIAPLRFDRRYNRYIEIYAYLRTREYGLGLHYAEEYLHDFDPTTWNWFAFMENYFLLALHARQYELAHTIFANAAINPHKSQLNRLAKERWTLYRAHLYLVSPDARLLGDFDYQAFVASVPHYSKDKAGFNVAILMLQFIQYVQKNDIDALLNRIEALAMYISRHLREQFSDRSRTMFRLLRIIVENNLNPKAVQQKSKYLAQKLASLPAPGDAYGEVEIIPYEHLWELCLEALPATREKAVNK